MSEVAKVIIVAIVLSTALTLGVAMAIEGGKRCPVQSVCVNPGPAYCLAYQDKRVCK